MIRNKKNIIYFIVLVVLFFLGCEKSSANKKGKENLSYNSITQLLEYGLTNCDENECIKNVNFAIENEIPLTYGMDMSNPIIEACKKDYYKLTEFLLEKGGNEYINYPASQYGPPLFWAIQNGNVSMVKLLLEHGADPNGHTSGDINYLEHLQYFVNENTYSAEIGKEIEQLLIEYGYDTVLEELPKSTSSSDPFIEYTIPGVNISFKYPNNERIKNLEIRKNIKEFNSENDVRINCKVYADEFFEHGNKAAFNQKFIQQFENDGEHINAHNILKKLAESDDRFLVEEKLGSYPIYKDIYYNGRVIGEDIFITWDGYFNYDLEIILEGYLVSISCTYASWKDTEARNALLPYVTYDSDADFYYFETKQNEESFNKFLFTASDGELPEILNCFRNTVKSIQESLYVPQYDEVFYEELLKSGFSKNGEYCFIGGHTPQYMFIWTKEKVGGKDDYKLFLFEDKKLVGYYKDIINIPFFANSQVEENKTFIVFNHNLESEDSLWLSGIPESLEFADEEHPLIKVEK